MKVVVLVILAPLVFALALYAARGYSGELVTLETRDLDGRAYESTLWIIEDGPRLWIRATDPTRPWLDRLINQSEVSLVYQGQAHRYHAEPMSNRRERVNGMMAEEYGWADWLLGLVENRDMAVPVRLARIYD